MSSGGGTRSSDPKKTERARAIGGRRGGVPFPQDWDWSGFLGLVDLNWGLHALRLKASADYGRPG